MASASGIAAMNYTLNDLLSKYASTDAALKVTKNELDACKRRASRDSATGNARKCLRALSGLGAACASGCQGNTARKTPPSVGLDRGA